MDVITAPTPASVTRRVLALLVLLAVLATATLFVAKAVEVRPMPTGTIVLRVNWGAIAMRGVTIIGGGVAVAMAPAITVPAVLSGLAGGAAAFDLTFNRCQYGINVGC